MRLVDKSVPVVLTKRTYLYDPPIALSAAVAVVLRAIGVALANHVVGAAAVATSMKKSVVLVPDTVNFKPLTET